MELICRVAIGAIVLLVVILFFLRRKPFYLYVWLPLWVNLLGSSGVIFCTGVALALKESRTHTMGPPGAADWIPILLVVLAVYLFIGAIAAVCVLPPRATRSRRSFVHAMKVAAAIFLALTLLEGCLVISLNP
jgi:uncharacterized membrane protein SirB2